MTSTKPPVTSRSPPHGKCDEPRSPTAEVHRGWLTRASAEHAHSVSRGPTASSVGPYLARLWFLKPLPIPPRHVPADTGVQLPVLSSRGTTSTFEWAKFLTFQVPDWFCMSPTPCLKSVWKAGKRSRNQPAADLRHVLVILLLETYGT